LTVDKEHRSAGMTGRCAEIVDADGRMRAAWKPLMEALAKMTPAEYARRNDTAQTALRNNGVTYNVYDRREGQSRRWRLDILPFVVDPPEWALIEAAAIQRARLADALLSDIYGPQQLINDGVLPPHIIFGHPQFLRPLVGLKPPGGVRVHLYSVDVARTTDGSWVVLSSRADAVSGIGYALENRIVVGQVFPDLFGEMRVRRLASFFNAYREAVRSLADGACGRAVLLTPGPHNEAYFEHAFLAHYLDLTLVEGDDLAVRDDKVFLKTLSGFEPVSVIFRRIDSDFCDPLELRADSALGVPGLTEAVRAGNVVLANALGGGVIESPALDAYLHAASRALLGEDLLIPDIPTVWCGTEWGRKEALDRLDRVIVRGAFDARPIFSSRSTAKLGGELSAEEILALKDRLARRGATIVTQDIVGLGEAPIYRDGEIASKPVSLRVFVAWTKDGYRVMPGALARVADNDTIRSLSLQSGALSKDVWVPSVGPVDRFSLLRPPGAAVPIQRTGESPPSRAMDNLFWLGRYGERADTLARVLRTVVRRLGDGAGEGADRKLLEFFSELLRNLPMGNPSRSGEDLGAALRALIAVRGTPDGLPQLLMRIRQTAWSARDRLSLDTWQTIHLMTEAEMLPSPGRPFDSAEALSSLDRLVRRSAAFAGYCAENMTRGPNWLFTDMGRRIERALHLTWLVGRIAGPSALAEPERIRIALDVSGSAMTYRSRYFDALQLKPLLDLLLFDESNPRSLAFQLDAVEKMLAELSHLTPDGKGAPAADLAAATRRLAAPADFFEDDVPVAPLLTQYLERIDVGICGVSDALTDAYFRHAVRRRTGGDAREV
jgi:uncharacterized circularly permuted ATP-grasp superfamily protein/uncharacterized alpha-E superfamily protein